jgi:hypothetical protein
MAMKTFYQAHEAKLLVGGVVAPLGPILYTLVSSVVCPGREHCSDATGCARRVAPIVDAAALPIVLVCLAPCAAAAALVLCSSGAWSFHRRRNKVAAAAALVAMVWAVFQLVAPFAHRAFVVPLPLYVGPAASSWRVANVSAGALADSALVSFSGVDDGLLALYGDLGQARVRLTVAIAEENGGHYPDRAPAVVTYNSSREADHLGGTYAPVVSAADDVAHVINGTGFAASWNVSGLRPGLMVVFVLSLVEDDGVTQRPALAWVHPKNSTATEGTLRNGQQLKSAFLVDVRPYLACKWRADHTGCEPR